MKYSIKMWAFTISTVLAGLAISSSVLALEGKFNAKVYPIDAAPVFIEDFTMNGKHKCFAEWRGGFITLLFQEVKAIKYLNPGSHSYHVEVTFNSGKKERLVLMPDVFHGKSEFGEWSMHSEKAVIIEFNPPPVSDAKADSEYINFDQILLKNGDTISGQIMTKAFKLRTSYSTLKFRTPQIGYLDFEGEGKSKDVMGLRTGDKLSGVLEVGSINLLMRSGAEVYLNKDLIRKITFVLVKR
jgi:hypothetical protein